MQTHDEKRQGATRTSFDDEVERCHERARELNAELRALLHIVDAPEAPEVGESSPLRGVPYVLKDVWETHGLPTTGGSYRHRERIAPRSSRVHRAFEGAGAVLIGKSNLCDMALSPESDNHLIGATRNPWRASRTSGGSTGGGAAAVAARMAAFDWGTDFGGSIRMPAGFCGIVGLRLSSATWPIPHGDFFPEAPELELELHGMGPLARSVDACEAILSAVAPALRVGTPTRTTSTEPRAVLYGPDAWSAGRWPTFAADASELLQRANVRFELNRELPEPREVDCAYNVYVASNFAAFVDTGEIALGEGLRAVVLGLASRGRLDRRIHPNTGLMLAALAVMRTTSARSRVRAMERARRVIDAAHAIWSRGELIVAPTSTFPAPRHGRAAFIRSLLAFAKLGNLTDATSIAIPMGRYASGMPRSLQILGPPGSEHAVLDLARRLEKSIQPIGEPPTRPH